MYPGYNAQQALQEDRVRELNDLNANQHGTSSGLVRRLAAFLRVRFGTRSSMSRAAQPHPQAGFCEQVQR